MVLACGPTRTAVRRGDANVVAMSDIQALADQIAREFQPHRIILFGSHAHGVPRPDADVDLLVILPFEGNPLRKSLEILDRVRPTVPIDVLARTPEQLRQRLAWNDFFLREIVEKGKVLYEAPDPRMG